MTAAGGPSAGARATRGRAPGRFHLLVVAMLSLLWVLAAAGPAAAHAEVVSTSPEDGEVLTEPPRALEVVFSEPVAVQDGTALVAPDGSEVEAVVEGADARVSLTPEEALGEGTYLFTWEVISADGHPISGAVSFVVGTPSATAPAAAPDDDRSLALAVVHRVSTSVWYAAVLVAGGLALFVGALLPGDRRKEVARTVHARLGRVGRIGVLVALVTGLVLGVVDWIWVSGSTRLPGPGAWSDPAAQQVRHTVVVAVLLALAWAALARDHGPVRARGPALVGVAAAGAALAVPALRGHTRAEGVWSAATAGDMVHLLAGGFWLGGLVGLILVLGWSLGRRSLGRGTADYAVTVIRRFSAAALGAVAALVVSGVVVAMVLSGRQWPAPTQVRWDALLVAKVAVVAVVVALAGFNRFRIVPVVAAGSGLRRLRRVVLAEAGLIAVVLGVTGVLTSTTPHVTQAATPVSAPDRSRVVEHQELEEGHAMVSLTPGDEEVTVEIEVLDDANDPRSLKAPPRVTAELPERGLGPLQRVARKRGAVYVTSLPLTVAGVWQVEAVLRTSRFESQTVTMTIRR